MDVQSAIAFLIASWGVLFVQLLLIFGAAFIAAAVGKDPQAVAQVAAFGAFGLFLVALIPAAILGSKASRLKKDAGIQ